ncbi:hypothetical protein GGD63_000320 [Bradyrhizobium sp. cir1]|uniref:hypothetical protein n=1 Tax=Bradyrhizobium sp. cir1 TaxID=1445730 RepID=UPI001606559D|nr:hypothetical protein [Bradyrhizobium sp. cir1]MBB4367551.1 hypothetical protein [Bradyrhizobium sp. cir1]
MKYNQKVGVGAGLYAIGTALILLALPAAAQSPSPAQARQWCFGTSKIDDRPMATVLASIVTALADFARSLQAR